MLLSVMAWQTLGFEKNKEFFEKIVQNGEVGHAYLFTGQEMIGKRTFALDLVSLILGASSTENNPNLLFINGENGISINQVRDLKKFFSFKPHSGKYKIAIIDSSHFMAGEAANALLKTLEEPAQYSLIILITSSPGQLPPTIRSRCEEIKFSPHPKLQLLKFLAGLGLSQTQAKFLADFSNGRLGMAYRLKENNSFKEIKIKLEEFNKLLKSNINERFNFAEKALQDEKNQDLNKLLLYWMFYLRSDLSKNLKINRAKILKSLLEVNQILSKPQYNHHLAFENFLINL